MASDRQKELLKNILGIQMGRDMRFKKVVIDTLTKAVYGDKKCLDHDEKCDCGDPEDLYRDLFDHDRYCPAGFTLKFVKGPDADLDEVELVIYEVDLSTRRNEETLLKYADLWWAFDTQSEDWVVRLVIVDKFGTFHEVSLCDLWYQQLCLEEKRPMEDRALLQRDVDLNAVVVDLGGTVRISSPPKSKWSALSWFKAMHRMAGYALTATASSSTP